jgi:hypothetical protein
MVERNAARIVLHLLTAARDSDAAGAQSSFWDVWKHVLGTGDDADCSPISGRHARNTIKAGCFAACTRWQGEPEHGARGGVVARGGSAHLLVQVDESRFSDATFNRCSVSAMFFSRSARRSLTPMRKRSPSLKYQGTSRSISKDSVMTVPFAEGSKR